MPAAVSPAPSIDEPLGSRIGPCKLLQKIGEGGCVTNATSPLMVIPTNDSRFYRVLMQQ